MWTVPEDFSLTFGLEFRAVQKWKAFSCRCPHVPITSDRPKLTNKFSHKSSTFTCKICSLKCSRQFQPFIVMRLPEDSRCWHFRLTHHFVPFRLCIVECGTNKILSVVPEIPDYFTGSQDRASFLFSTVNSVALEGDFIVSKNLYFPLVSTTLGSPIRLGISYHINSNQMFWIKASIMNTPDVSRIPKTAV